MVAVQVADHDGGDVIRLERGGLERGECGGAAVDQQAFVRSAEPEARLEASPVAERVARPDEAQPNLIQGLYDRALFVCERAELARRDPVQAQIARLPSVGREHRHWPAAGRWLVRGGW